MAYNGTPATLIRARDLTAGDLIDGTMILVRLADEGFTAHHHDWRDAERRLWDAERVTHCVDGRVIVKTGRHGTWVLRGDLPVTTCGSLIREAA